MKLALISSYDRLIQGLGKAAEPANRAKLKELGWDQPQHNALAQILNDVRAAEQTLYAATHALSERISEAEHLLLELDTAFKLAGSGSILPADETSFRYSTSMSSSSSLSWRYNSGSVWVTTSSGCQPPVLRKGSSPTKHFAKKVVKKKAVQGTSPMDNAVKKTAKSKTAKKRLP